jgi:hypothetical protein
MDREDQLTLIPMETGYPSRSPYAGDRESPHRPLGYSSQSSAIGQLEVHDEPAPSSLLDRYDSTRFALPVSETTLPDVWHNVPEDRSDGLASSMRCQTWPPW